VKWLLGVAVLAVLAVAGYVVYSGDRLPRGATVVGVAVGGLSTAEATQRLTAELGTREQRRVRLIAGPASTRVKPARMGLQFDAAATVQSAVPERWEILTHLTGGGEVAPVVTVDEQRLRTTLDELAEDVDLPLVEPTIRYTGTVAEVVPGRAGRELDRAAGAQRVVTDYLTGEVVLPVTELPTTVDIEQAQRVRDEVAVPAVAEPITLTAEGIPATVAPEALADALSFEAQDGTLIPVVRGETIHAAARDAWARIETPGRDASFRIEQGTPVVVPSKLGRGVHDEELSAAVEQVLLERGAARAATVEVSQREPDLSTAEAENLGITQRLSRHTEVFPYARYREINIGRAARYLDGTVLLPGQTYSMNDTVKERTPENGYTVGYIVGAGGRLQEAQGGGVSTVATATWVAAFYAGLEKVEQRAHTIWIPRYMAGLEATVAWGALDLKVRNNTGNGVLITAKTTPTSITVSFWGTKKYSRIKAEFGPKYNVRGFDTVTDSSPACVSNPGTPGFDIDVDRVFLREGREVRRQTFTTNYIPAPRVVCTGGGDRIG
jgi:vancomycin resistance protein YoaR